MGVLGRIIDVILACPSTCRRLCGLFQGSPLVCFLVTLAILILVTTALIFNMCLARLFTVPGAFLMNLGMLWLLLRLIVRALVFPGSIVLWKRNTEASYRVEMSKQFSHHLEHLHAFLLQATRRSRSANPGATMEGVLLGCMVIKSLARNFRVQQRDQVRFTAEQALVKLLVQGVESWLSDAKVCEKPKSSEATTPFWDWIQRVAQSLVPVPFSLALASTLLESKAEAEATACIEHLEQLIQIFIELQNPVENFCSNARRFMRVPTVGSLDQLRAELLVRYSGHHYWIRTPSGRKIDAMFISRNGDTESTGLDGMEAQGADSNETVMGESPKNKEDTPLTCVVSDLSRSDLGSVIIWCNPNAAYYETMAYESHWLDFYLSQGCSVLLFNYSGFGRSQGNPTPRALASDGSAIVEFLKRRGFTQIGVHGRSIGGIAACSIAQAHQDVVKILVADRTFSTLGAAARFTFGNWAVKGLSIAATWADNYANFARARCYKVMICDPKDATIPDFASLRSAVGIHALETAPPSDRLSMDTDKIQRLADAWIFMETLISICDRDGVSAEGHCESCYKPMMEIKLDSKRPARQPIVGKPAPDADVLIDIGEDDKQHLISSSRARGDSRKNILNTQWLEEHVEFVRSLMSGHIDIIRVAIDLVGTSLNASGMTLDDVFGRGCEDAQNAVRCFLANLQVWGSLGSLREPKIHGIDRDVELLLSKGVLNHDSSDQVARLQKVMAALTPDSLAAYHRHLSRALIAQVRREFRQHLASVRRVLEPVVRDGAPAGSQLCSIVLSNLREIESFLTAIYRFFKCMDISGNAPPPLDAVDSGAGPGLAQAEEMVRKAYQVDGDDSSDETQEGRERNAARTPLRPTLDRSVTGYVMCIDCGHNGVLNEGEVQHLAMHLRAAKFGKYDATGGGGGSAV